MPTIGKSAIAQKIAAKSFEVENTGATVQYQEDVDFVQRLANAIHTGWTSLTPVTPTAMLTSFASVFADYTGQGRAMLDAIATGIDQESSAWAASWNPTLAKHLYAPSAATIKSKILAASPFQSNAVTALAEATSEAYMSGFKQEEG